MITGQSTDSHPSQTATEFAVTGMTCANCARHVTEAIQSVPAVASASVQLEAGRATVRWQSPPNPAAVINAVEKAGYEARPIDSENIKAGTLSSPLADWQT